MLIHSLAAALEDSASAQLPGTVTMWGRQPRLSSFARGMPVGACAAMLCCCPPGSIRRPGVLVQ
jgi:hypothetical protein